MSKRRKKNRRHIFGQVRCKVGGKVFTFRLTKKGLTVRQKFQRDLQVVGFPLLVHYHDKQVELFPELLNVKPEVVK